MLEKDFQTKFTRWLKSGSNIPTGAFELKLSKGISLPFNAVQDHQIAALKIAKHGRLAFKIPDDSRGTKPMDCFLLAGTDAWVVVMFWERGQKEFFLIDVDAFVAERDSSKRKSLTSDRARGIGTAFMLA